LGGDAEEPLGGVARNQEIRFFLLMALIIQDVGFEEVGID
jgi:hypothetical protein